MSRPTRDRASRRTLAVLIGVLGALITVAAFTPRRSIVSAIGVTPAEAADLVLRDPTLQAAALELILARPEARQALERRLTEKQVENYYDAHVDPEVGRVLQPNLSGRVVRGKTLDTNQMGLREGKFVWSKPDGVTRVVLLGDSYVYGFGLDAEERFGVHLKRLLEPYCPTPKLEVLHLGVSSWNLQAESAYLRRQLGELKPDLVIHVGFVNDFADVLGVRGIGVMARMSPQAIQRGESPFTDIAMIGAFPAAVRNHLHRGLDWESRTRIRRAGEHVMALAEALEAVDCPYLFVGMFEETAPLVRRLLVPDLEPEKLCYVSLDFRRDSAHWNAPNDRHWNPLASERIALGLYGLIGERDLLEGWELPADPAADEWRAAIFDRGELDAVDEAMYSEFIEQARITSSFEFPPIDRPMAAMATGGVDKEGFLSSYASFCMRRGGGILVVDLDTLDRPALAGREATVFLDEVEVGRVPLDDPSAFPARFEVPADVADREFLSVRFAADEYVYVDHVGRPGCARVRAIRFE